MRETNAILLRDWWYAAAWDCESIDGRSLARTILEKPVLRCKGESAALGGEVRTASRRDARDFEARGQLERMLSERAARRPFRPRIPDLTTTRHRGCLQRRLQ